MPPSLKINILGQGLAGTALAWECLFQNVAFAIFDPGEAEECASRAAMGVVNPLTGPRMASSWPPFALRSRVGAFYTAVQERLGKTFWRETELFRPFLGPDHRGDTMLKLSTDPERRLFVRRLTETSPQPQLFDAPWGGVFLGPAGRLDVPAYLEASRDYFARLGLLNESGSESLPGRSDGLTIHCRGWRDAVEGPFTTLPFQAVKGEILRLRPASGGRMMVHELIVSRDITLVFEANGSILAGATHLWDVSDGRTTDQGRTELLKRLQGWFHTPVEVLGQWAGVRPALRDHHPVTGLHPQDRSLGLLNGLGSRGVSHAPLLASLLLNHLSKGSPLPKEIGLDRFKLGK